jgi:hypothetical protein
VTLLARETLPPISLSPALLRWSSARTPFPLFAPLAPAPGETADSRVFSGPGPEVLYAPCQPQRSPTYGIQSAGCCIPGACLDCLQATKCALVDYRQRLLTKVPDHLCQRSFMQSARRSKTSGSRGSSHARPQISSYMALRSRVVKPDLGTGHIAMVMVLTEAGMCYTEKG